MTRKFVLLISLILVFLLTGCKSVKEFRCESEDGYIIKIIYNNEEILEAYDDGIKISYEEIDEVNVYIKKWYSTVHEYIEEGIEYQTAEGDTCKVTNKISWFGK